MYIYLFNRKALVRVLSAGHLVWCKETGEGWQAEGGCSLNRARKLVRWILAEEERETFFFKCGR